MESNYIPRTAFLWQSFGPYHFARFAAAKHLFGSDRVLGIEVSNRTTTYAWQRSGDSANDVISLVCDCPGELVPGLKVWKELRAVLREHEIDVLFIPSYWPMSSLVSLVVARCLGVHVVMMNESHSGTSLATGFKRWAKRPVLRLFGAALVGGTPHVRHFITLGMARDAIFTGYDAVDNDFFLNASIATREMTSAVRERYGLPVRYIISLGRLVAKKNLVCLLRAYALLFALDSSCPALVMVGAGDEEEALMALARELNLAVIDARSGSAKREAPSGGAVYFYGFRQINENPSFYALAECFVLPSLLEEWGLVVNEAMACGLPVVVSQTAGCAEDLVEEEGNGYKFDPSDPSVLADRLMRLAVNPMLRAGMGKRSLEIIRSWGCDNFARQALRAGVFALGEG